MLLLIGLGLDTKDISVRALEEIETSDVLMLDPYTNIISDQYIEYLEKSSKKKIIKLSRSDLEENVPMTIGQAKTKKIAILVSGDPMIATTHQIIIDHAANNSIPYKIIHSSSIFHYPVHIVVLAFYMEMELGLVELQCLEFFWNYVGTDINFRTMFVVHQNTRLAFLYYSAFFLYLTS